MPVIRWTKDLRKSKYWRISMHFTCSQAFTILGRNTVVSVWWWYTHIKADPLLAAPCPSICCISFCNSFRQIWRDGQERRGEESCAMHGWLPCYTLCSSFTVVTAHLYHSYWGVFFCFCLMVVLPIASTRSLHERNTWKIKFAVIIWGIFFLGKRVSTRDKADGGMWPAYWNNPAKASNNWNKNQGREGKNFTFA